MRKFNEFAQVVRVSQDEKYMRMAIVEAEKAKQKGDFPVGAILACSSAVLKEYNTINSEGDPTAHAVMNLVRKSSPFKKHLNESIIYSTTEPCLMCIKAAEMVGIKELIFGCYDKINGFMSNNILRENAEFALAARGGLLANECIELFDEKYRQGLSE